MTVARRRPSQTEAARSCDAPLREMLVVPWFALAHGIYNTAFSTVAYAARDGGSAANAGAIRGRRCSYNNSPGGLRRDGDHDLTTPATAGLARGLDPSRRARHGRAGYHRFGARREHRRALVHRRRRLRLRRRLSFL